MNFLAHLHLSGDDEEIKIGNFIGDFVKGKEMNNYSPGISKGIKVHRAIDSFTDQHPIVSQSKDRLRAKYRHYSGVIVDVYYDHFLAANWSQYSDLPLSDFAQDAYQLIQGRLTELPDQIGKLLHYMSSGNWLYNYQYVDGIQRTLTGMSNRTRFESKMEQAHLDLKEHYEAFSKEFAHFYPLLQDEMTRLLSDSDL